jgi:hypothetical protein
LGGLSVLAIAPAVIRNQQVEAVEHDLTRVGPVPTLLVYNTAQGLLAGDLDHVISPAMVQDDIDSFPADWVALGVGTTNQRGRTGEIIPDGTSRHVRFWWADPASPSQADVSNLTAVPSLSSVELPFLAIGVADTTTAIEWPLTNVSGVHAWLKKQLEAAGIDMAAIRLEGTFGDVMTTVSYNIPPTGIPGGVYSGDSYFRFGDYPSGFWKMDGVFADPAALQPVISTAGNPVHLHGYQPVPELGGHIVSAVAVEVKAYVFPLTEIVIRPTPIA